MTLIRGGPRLVDSGRATMTARSEGFRTLPVSARRTRTAVGLTRDNHLQFVAVRQGITLWELAKLMRAMGAYHAVALDGGRPGVGAVPVRLALRHRDATTFGAAPATSARILGFTQ